ncbi:MAG: helicase-associated domain-containing protein [Cellulomonas sp.]|uniref:helicase-associated domain-containing protein n=1 Tax=Cellulomonas sp. TaxID=40001 RepID=UPI001835CE2F|nr:helicase-associated domain-containing protein [Cellulomonas sp.]NMM31135.1 helicase-associated domain-containing protein [Cellulomonas sp.]
MATFSEDLRSRSDDELVALLRRRPDLASPSPSTLSSLAARATSRASLERALGSVDAVVLQAVEAVVALHDDATPVTADRVAQAVGARSDADRELVDMALARAVSLLLVRLDEEPATGTATGRGLLAAPGLAELLGPYPAGLPPAGTVSGGPAPTGRNGAVTPTVPAPLLLGDVLADAPPGARQVLDALMWGPPVGLLPAVRTPARDAVQWLLTHGLLFPGDTRHVLLARDVALALRSGRTHAELRRPPAAPSDVRHPLELVAGESVMAAQRIVRLVASLVRTWEIEPAPVLRTGGLGVRELRKLAAQLETEEADTAFVVELAGAAGLVADDREEIPSFAPTLAVDDWLTAELSVRWALLARMWLTTNRTAWMVGARDDRGTVRAALNPELTRPWAPRLRASVLGVLADAAPGTALTVAQVSEQLAWRTPRALPPTAAVAATLREAGLLGVVAAGALSPAGRALLPDLRPLDEVAATARSGDGRRARSAAPSSAGARAQPDADDVAAALRDGLADAVDEILLQGDLTGVVPGRPSPELEALIERAARVESRGGALTVRFTPESVRAALDAGTTADELLAGLAAHSRGSVPQPLDYLVRDAARRHGRLRAGAASSYVRAEDPALLAGLVEDPRLAAFGLVRLAPTVLAAQVSTRELLAALRERGLAPVAEGPDGHIVHAERVIRRVTRRPRRGLVTPPDDASHSAAARAARVAALVPELRRAELAQQADLQAQLADREAHRVAARSRADDAASAATAARAAGRGTAADDALGSSAAELDQHASVGGRPRAVDAGPRGGVGHRPLARCTTPATPATSATSGGTADPVAALGLLREAVEDRTDVWLELVDAHGVPQRRRVRPLRLEAGRLRALDPARDSELTVAVHRIASVARVEPDPLDPTEETHD